MMLSGYGACIVVVMNLVPWILATPIRTQGLQQHLNDDRFDHLKPVRRLVVFGDSLSDNGHGAYLLSNGTWPADPHYYKHHFTNGPVYAEGLATHFGWSLDDRAIGGATTSNELVQGYTGPSSTIPVPSVEDQVIDYVSELVRSGTGSIDETLFLLYGGGNDAFFGLPNITANQVVSNLIRSVNKLKAIGAKHIVLPTLPPLGRHYPFATLTPTSDELLDHYSAAFRSLILKAVDSDNAIIAIDFYALYSKVEEFPKKYGFDKSKLGISCLKGVYAEVPGNVTVCSEPDKYLWWDEYHPTKRMHAFMAQTALHAMAKHIQAY